MERGVHVVGGRDGTPPEVRGGGAGARWPEGTFLTFPPPPPSVAMETARVPSPVLAAAGAAALEAAATRALLCPRGLFQEF